MVLSSGGKSLCFSTFRFPGWDLKHIILSGINVILDGEVVTVTTRQPTIVARPKGYIHRTESLPITEPGEPGRMLITLITASLARGYASFNPTGEATEAGFLAFDGEYVSGNTTLVCDYHCRLMHELILNITSARYKKRQLGRLTGCQKMTRWILMSPNVITRRIVLAVVPLLKK